MKLGGVDVGVCMGYLVRLGMVTLFDRDSLIQPGLRVLQWAMFGQGLSRVCPSCNFPSGGPEGQADSGAWAPSITEFGKVMEGEHLRKCIFNHFWDVTRGVEQLCNCETAAMV